MAKLLQYQEEVNGIPNSLAPERTTPDKWQPNTNIPQSNWQKAALYSAAAIMPFFAMNLTPAQTVEQPKVFAPQSVVITHTRLTQYQGRVDPLRPLAAPETVTVDKWFENTEKPTWKVPNQSWITGDYALSLNNGQRPERVSLDRWQQPQSLPRFDVARNQFLYPNFFVDSKQLTQNERSTPDKWQPETNKPLFDVKRQQFSYPSLFFHPEPQEVTQFESPSEFSRNVDKVYDRARTQYLYPTFTIDENLLASEETVSFDRWNFNQSLPRFDVARNQHTYPSSFFYPEPKEVTEFEDLLHQQDVTVRDVKRNQYLYPSFFTDPRSLTQTERSTPDKWQPETNRPRFDIARNQFSYPNSFFYPLPQPRGNTVDQWWRETEKPVWKRPNNNWITSGDFELSNAQRTERTSLDKWFAQASQPFFIQKLPIQQNGGVIFVAERITLDKWFAPNVQPLSKAVIQQPQPNGLLFVAETITSDKWFQAIVQPQKPLQTLTYGEIVTVQTIARTDLTGLFFPPTQTPVLDIKRDQYLYLYQFQTGLTSFPTVWRPRTKPTDIWTPRTKPITAYTARTKPTTTYSPRTKPTSNWTPRTKPTSNWTPRQKP